MSIKLTKKRQAILDALKATHGALTAKEIHRALPGMDLVTIYRNLDLFVSEKLIKKLNLASAEAQYEYQEESHHHALCDHCERIVHFTAPDAKIKQLLGIEDFAVDEIEVTVRGTCKKHH